MGKWLMHICYNNNNNNNIQSNKKSGPKFLPIKSY
jgi:hypothetical protein